MSGEHEQRIDNVISALEEQIAKSSGRFPDMSATGGASTITVNAGGIGVWISVTCCGIMLACNLFMIALYVDQQQQIRDLSDYLTAIYAMAPHLKPETAK